MKNAKRGGHAALVREAPSGASDFVLTRGRFEWILLYDVTGPHLKYWTSEKLGVGSQLATPRSWKKAVKRIPGAWMSSARRGIRLPRTDRGCRSLCVDLSVGRLRQHVVVRRRSFLTGTRQRGSGVQGMREVYIGPVRLRRSQTRDVLRPRLVSAFRLRTTDIACRCWP